MTDKLDYQQIEELQQRYVLGTYAPQITFVRGKGSYLWDSEGNKYLDLAMGISVSNIGHCHKKVADAVCKQAKTLCHTSNLFKNVLQPQFAAKIASKSFGGRVFFANSGAEANEGLIKFARKWGHNEDRYEIICMDHSFHGRTLATLAATGRKKYCVGFAPNVEGFVSVPYNDLEAVKAAITPKTVAILLEPVQGEGGIIPATKEFFTGIRKLCDDNKLLMLIDEVQTGIGRTGAWFAYQHYGVKPDGMSMAKALGNGLPVGAFEVRADLNDILVPGTHASTFGGNPLVCAAGLATFETIEEENLIEESKAKGEFFRTLLRKMAKKHPNSIQDVRGLGLMIGIETTLPLKDIIAAAARRFMIVLPAGENIVRLLPALNITTSEINKAVGILDKVFTELETK